MDIKNLKSKMESISDITSVYLLEVLNDTAGFLQMKGNCFILRKIFVGIHMKE